MTPTLRSRSALTVDSGSDHVPDDFGKLARKLDVLIALALCQLEHRTEVSDVIGVLSRFEIPPRDIARMLGMTPNAVSVARHRARRGSRKRDQGKRK
jgi:hypothetical protein